MIFNIKEKGQFECLLFQIKTLKIISLKLKHRGKNPKIPKSMNPNFKYQIVYRLTQKFPIP